MTVQTEAKELAKKVVKFWKEGNDENAKKICDEYIQSLLDEYSPSYVAKDCQRIFRKAIFQESGLLEYRYSEKPVSFFTVPKTVLSSVNNKSRKSVSSQRGNLVKVPTETVRKLFDVCNQLLSKEANKAQDIYNKVLALALLTGRRCYSEIMFKATFEPSELCNRVSFSGQAKGGLEKGNKSYNIPVLACEPDTVINSLNEVQEYLFNRQWWNEESISEEKDYIKRRCNKQLKAGLDRWFMPILSEIEGLEKFSIHDFRKLYASICYHNQKTLKLYSSSNPAFTSFSAEILGHSYLNDEGEEMADTKTSESYEKYEIVD